MLNKLKEIYNKKVMEMYDPNSYSPEYSNEYVKRLLKPVEVNPFDYEDDVTPEKFYASFRKAVKGGVDEVELQYPDGQKIVLDIVVAKHLLMYASSEDIIAGAYNPNVMNRLIRDICDVVDLDDDEDGEDE